jgi:PKD repeat protein
MRNRNGIFGSFAGLACAAASLALLATGCSDASSDYPLQVTILASATDGAVPMTVEFQAVAVGGDAPYEYSWNFADGSEASSEPNPVHTFDAVGRYDVIVVVTDGGGNEVTRTLAVEVHPTLSVQVAVDPTGGVAPLQVAASATVTGGMPPYRYEWDFGDGNGSNRQVATNVYQTGGTFTVNLTVRDALDQAADAQATVTVRDDHVPIATIRALPTVGIAPLTVAFAGTAVGGDAPMTWAWHFGDGDKATTQDADHEYEDAGRYTAVLVVTDADGDQGTAQVEIVVGTDAVPAVQATATPAAGVAPLTVRLEAQAAGGNAPLAYAWDFDDDGKTDATVPAPVHVFASGTHDVTVTVTDADGDEAEATVTVTVQADTTPVVTAEATPEAGRAPLSAAFTCTATGINLPYAYHWDFGDGATSVLANPAHTYAQGGDYTATCTVVDADGDIASGTVAVAVAANRVPRIAITANPLVGVVPFDVSFQAAGDGGDAPVNYLWTFGNGNSSTAANPTHRYTAPGTYTVVLSATDADGDSAVAQVQVTATADGVPAVEIAALPTTGIAPLRVAFQANVAGGNAPIQYDWSFGDGTKSVVANPVKTFAAGSHTVSVTVRDADGDTDTETVTIVASTDTGPDATAQAAPATGTAPLAVAFTCAATGGNPPLSYHWDFGDGTSSPLANPSRTYTQAGTYIASCAVTDADGDTDVSATTVTVAADRQPQVVAVATPAAGVAPMEVAFQATVLGGDGPFTYAWTFGDGASSDQDAPVHVYETPGTYVALVVVTDADGDQATAFVTVDMTTDDVPVVEITGGPLAGIEPLDVRFQAAVAGGNGTLRYEWDFDTPVDGTATVPAPARTFAAGTYDVVLTVTDEDGDTATDTVQVVVDADTVPSPGASAAPMAGLAPLTVAFQCGADGGNPPLAYRWEFGDGAASSLANPSYTYPRAGAYQAICTVTDADGDAASDAVSVAVHEDTAPRVQVRATPTAGLAPLEVRFASSVVGGNPPLQYEWDFDDGSMPSGVPDPMHVYAPGTFTARLTVTDADGDQDVADVAISVGDASQPAAEIAIDPTAGAAPLLVRFHCEAVGGNPPYAYRWTFGDGASADTPDAEHVYTFPGEFQPRCTVTDAFGQAGSQSWYVDVAPSNAVPFIDMLFLDNGWPDTAPECAAVGQTRMLLTVVAGDADGDPLSYEWRFDEVPPGSTAWFNNPGVMNPTFVPDLPGTYVARVFVRDGRGGQASDTLVVNAEIPNAVVAVSPEPPLAGVADETFPEPLVARVETACGVPFAGIPVQWSAFNGFLMAATGVSDDAGRVTATVRLGCTAGEDAEFRAAVDGLAWDAHFGITVEPNAPAALILEAGQDVPIADADGNPVPMAITARLLDRCGNAVVDADVTFDLHVQPSPPTCLAAPCSEGGVGDLAGLQTVGGVWTGNAYGTVVGEVPFRADNLSVPSIVTGGWRIGQPIDFEADGGGFMVGADASYPDEWEWGEPTVPVAAHSGTHAWDTRVNEDYRPSIGDWPEHRFLFRDLNLPCTGGMPVELRFWEYHDIGDHALARVAANCPQCPELMPLDAETAYDATLDGFSGYQGISAGWREVRMDLTPWQCGGVTVFWDLYLSQAGMSRAGWTIDDVSLRFFSEWVTGRFVAGPPHSGTVSVSGGVVGCSNADASVWLQVMDIGGNPVPGAEVRLDLAGTGSILVTDVESGELLSQGAGTATIRIDENPSKVRLSDTIAETVTLTLPDLVNPWGDGGTPTGMVPFVDAADETPAAGLCFDGYDNDCDGFADCADAACAAEPACMPDLIPWYHRWDPTTSTYEVAFCNYGLVSTSGPFEIAMYVRGPGGAEPLPPLDASWAAVREYPENLAVMECNSVVFPGNLPFGDYDLYAVLDWDSRIPESHEDDNLIYPGAPLLVSIPFGEWENPANGNCLDGIDNEPDLFTDCENSTGAPACKTDGICQNLGSPLDSSCNGVDDTGLGVPDLAACRCVNDSGCDAIGPGYRCYDEMNQFGPGQAFCAPPCGDMFWWSVFPGMPSYDVVCNLLTGGMLNFCDKYAGRCM